MSCTIVESVLDIEYKLKSGSDEFLLNVRIKHDVKQIDYCLVRYGTDGGSFYFRNMSSESLDSFAGMLKQVASKIIEILAEHPKYKLLKGRRF